MKFLKRALFEKRPLLERTAKKIATISQKWLEFRDPKNKGGCNNGEMCKSDGNAAFVRSWGVGVFSIMDIFRA